MESASIVPPFDPDIPSGGILSTVVYQDDDVRVVGFAFDRDQELTDHMAASPAIVQVLTGTLRLQLGASSVEVGPGAWIHLPARLPHAVFAVEPSTMLLTLIRCR